MKGSSQRKLRKQGWFKPKTEQQGGLPTEAEIPSDVSTLAPPSLAPPSLAESPTSSRTNDFHRSSSGIHMQGEKLVPSPSRGLEHAASAPPRQLTKEITAADVMPMSPPPLSRRSLGSSHSQRIPPTKSASSSEQGTSRRESLASAGRKTDVAELLFSGVDDERMYDVSLIGRSGTGVKAIRYVLASLSPVFQEQLYHDTSKLEIYIGPYSEAAIRTLKEYCHTGNVRNSPLAGKKNAESARGWVEVASLARIYGFEPLYGEADSILNELITASPWFATACYDAAGKETRIMEDFLVYFIEGRSPDLLMETNALKYLSPPRLAQLLGEMKASDVDKFQYIEKWLELKNATPDNISFAKKLASEKISLSMVLSDPDMELQVRSSALFDDEAIENANKNAVETIDIY